MSERRSSNSRMKFREFKSESSAVAWMNDPEYREFIDVVSITNNEGIIGVWYWY